LKERELAAGTGERGEKEAEGSVKVDDEGGRIKAEWRDALGGSILGA